MEVWTLVILWSVGGACRLLVLFPLVTALIHEALCVPSVQKMVSSGIGNAKMFRGFSLFNKVTEHTS